MATIKSTKDLGHHARLDEDPQNEHFPKAFLPAAFGRYLTKDVTGNISYELMPILPAALDFVDSMVTPDTEVDGDIYILDASFAALDVDTIDWQSGTTVRYTFNGSPDLSSISNGDFLEVKLATKTSNNGIFVITDVNDGSDFIEVTNAARTDATDDEATDSPATATPTHRDWDGAPQLSYVKFDATEGKWNFIVPVISQRAEDLTAADTRKFTGSAWIIIAGDNGIFGGSGSLGADTTVTMGTNGLMFDGNTIPDLLNINGVNDKIIFGGSAGSAFVTIRNQTGLARALEVLAIGGASALFQVDEIGGDGVIKLQDASPATTVQIHSGGLSFLNGGGLTIGDSAIDASALFELTSTTQGALLPRMTTTQRDAIGTPATGLEIYNTTTDVKNFYDGTSWLAVGENAGRRTILVTLFGTETDVDIVAVGSDNLPIIGIPAEYNGWTVVDYYCFSRTPGATGTTDWNLKRNRGGTEVDVLSTPITQAAERFANDGTINLSNDDLATGDILIPFVSDKESTPPKGGTVGVVIEKV